MKLRPAQILYVAQVEATIVSVTTDLVGAATAVNEGIRRIVGDPSNDVPDEAVIRWTLSAFDSQAGQIGVVSSSDLVAVEDLMTIQMMIDDYILSGKLRGVTSLR